MKAHRRKRLLVILAAIAALGAVAGLILYGLQSKVDFFLTPADITAGKAPEERSFRLGGLVKAGSFRREPDSLKVYFTVADNTSELAVTYDKILPDLFREGQGVIADGQLNEQGVFVASKIIAKHDENYMSPQLKKKLEERGHVEPGSSEKGPTGGDPSAEGYSEEGNSSDSLESLH